MEKGSIIAPANRTPPPDTAAPSPRPRPRITVGRTTKAKTGCGSLFITINQDDEGLFEVFTNLGKASGCPSQSEATARILSVAFRCGVDPEILVEQLKGIRCLSTIARRRSNKDVEAPEKLPYILLAERQHKTVLVKWRRFQQQGRPWRNRDMVNNRLREFKRHLKWAGIEPNGSLSLHMLRKSCVQNWQPLLIC